MSFEGFKRGYADNLKFINPNILSVLALLVSIETGYYFLDANKQKFLYIWIVVLLLFRLILNWTTKAIMEAREDGASKNVYYQIADKYSELFIWGGFMVSRLTNFYLGFFTLISMVLVCIIGLIGKAQGVGCVEYGPMCKLGRTLLLVIILLVEYFCMKHGRPFMIFDLETGKMFSWQDLGAVFLIILAQLTIFIRILEIRKRIQSDESKKW